MSEETAVKIPVKAFIQVKVAGDDWDLPIEVVDLLKSYSRLIPMSFFLSWPIEALPGVGETINLYGVAGDLALAELKVEKIERNYLKERGVEVFAYANTFEASKINMGVLATLAEEGFMTTDPSRYLKEILWEAGLPSTWEEYEKIRK